MHKSQDKIIFSLCILLACQMVFSLFIPQQGVQRAVVSMLVYALCMCAPTLFLTLDFTPNRDKNVYPDKLFFCIFFCLGIIHIGNTLSVIMAHFLESFGISPPEGIKIYTEPAGVVFSFINFVILPSILEELLVRRYIIGHLSRYSKTQALIFSSLVFGFFHMNVMQIPFAVLCGFVFGYFTIKTSSIKFSVTMHFLNNLSAFILSYADLPTSKNLFIIRGVIAVTVTAISGMMLYKNGYFREKFRKPVFSAMTVFYFMLCTFIACTALR